MPRVPDMSDWDMAASAAPTVLVDPGPFDMNDDTPTPLVSTLTEVQGMIVEECRDLSRRVCGASRDITTIFFGVRSLFSTPTMRAAGRLDSAIQNFAEQNEYASIIDVMIAGILLRVARSLKGTPYVVTDIHQMIDGECRALATLLVEKNKAYGNSALDPVRIFSKAPADAQILVRIDDKLSRVARGHAAGEDVLLDLLGYLVLLRVCRRMADVTDPE